MKDTNYWLPVNYCVQKGVFQKLFHTEIKYLKFLHTDTHT